MTADELQAFLDENKADIADAMKKVGDSYYRSQIVKTIFGY